MYKTFSIFPGPWYFNEDPHMRFTHGQPVVSGCKQKQLAMYNTGKILYSTYLPLVQHIRVRGIL